MPDGPLNLPVLLTKIHDVRSFDCGAKPLNDFLTQYACKIKPAEERELTF